ncbi:hypothetical protein ERO13_A12G131800v2 [Gossypium hirsutum]|nr:hypothetical protein ERO13_A12G131800v2 [Gossypium hirsutum]
MEKTLVDADFKQPVEAESTMKSTVESNHKQIEAISVDKSLSQLERHVPFMVKQASSQARTVASEVQRVGVVDVAKSITRDIYTKYKLTAKEMYDKYEPVAEQYVVFAWRSLNRLPFFPQVAQVVLPTTAYWSEKYNQVVQHFGENGYVVAAYLPLIPINRITKVFIDDGRAPVVSSNGESVQMQ